MKNRKQIATVGRELVALTKRCPNGLLQAIPFYLKRTEKQTKEKKEREKRKRESKEREREREPVTHLESFKTFMKSMIQYFSPLTFNKQFKYKYFFLENFQSQ